MFNISFEETGLLSNFTEYINDFNKDDDSYSLLILSSVNNQFVKDDKQLKEFDSLIKNTKKPIIGGFFPELIFEARRKEIGNIFIKMPRGCGIFSIDNFTQRDIQGSFSILKFGTNMKGIQTILIFIDGLAKGRGINKFLENLYEIIGTGVNYVGGGAGSLDTSIEKCLFASQKGLFKDGAIFLTTDYESAIGVKHGWKKYSEKPIKVKADDNILMEINGKSALEGYNELIKDDNSKKELNPKFIFGIEKTEGEELIIRDPFKYDANGSIRCIGGFPEDKKIYIMTGEKDSLINAAKNVYYSANEISKDIPKSLKNCTLLFDCISRKNYLGNIFDKEIQVFYRRDNKTIGALTIGEIASKTFPEFYNKTIVFCILKQKKKDMLKYLTPTELEVAEFIRKGCTNAEIAGILNKSVHTINGHVKNMLKKLDVTTRTEIAYILGASGIFDHID